MEYTFKNRRNPHFPSTQALEGTSLSLGRWRAVALILSMVTPGVVCRLHAGGPAGRGRLHGEARIEALQQQTIRLQKLGSRHSDRLLHQMRPNCPRVRFSTRARAASRLARASASSLETDFLSFLAPVFPASSAFLCTDGGHGSQCCWSP